jgi:DNA-binding response OmpR family regulator
LILLRAGRTRHPRRRQARPKLRTVYTKTPLTKTERAYLLEDDEANAVVAEEYLKLYGFEEVVWRRSLEDAAPDLPALAGGRFDLILLDVMLPDGTSVGFLNQIKAGGCPCPIGFYTAKSELEDESFYDAHGCDFVFAKPLLLQEFTATMDELKAA